SIVVVTDADAMGSLDALEAAAKLLRLHGHALAFIVPDATTFAPAPTSELEREVFRVYQRTERRHFEELLAVMTKLGVPVLSARADDRPGVVVVRAQRATKRRAA